MSTSLKLSDLHWAILSSSDHGEKKPFSAFPHCSAALTAGQIEGENSGGMEGACVHMLRHRCFRMKAHRNICEMETKEDKRSHRNKRSENKK